MATGQCLCGAIRYRAGGTLRDAIVCHCVECRRWHGASPPMVAAARDALTISGEVRWYPEEGTPRRGFCARCGASVFWDAVERPTLGIAAGTLDNPTGVRIIARIFTSHASDYEGPWHDDLPAFERGLPPQDP
ncbi:hypothetical protein EV191_12050 [Tamaricihabitans halophyticus]|uniref:CENP-V/GFA domain-containing protein n=1 Tax=Tamaricihabitans halophyticus TaxID=1262583 RepID=A0A4V2SRU0_9PSEU|nr:GFA family protein [Tamaricihabitans halophyticus]TCP43896.1 hypothetical protein EV191_12050 [Tamaricihabitans halophyticus]